MTIGQLQFAIAVRNRGKPTSKSDGGDFLLPVRALSVTLRETARKVSETSFWQEVQRFFFVEWAVSHFENTSTQYIGGIMHVWSKALAVALVVTLWGFGATALQAKDHKDKSCEPPGCPAPVLTPPVVEGNCCPMDTVKTHCEPPVQCGCNPVDPKAVSEAQEEALKKQHDAVKAQKKRQEAIAKAQRELEEKTAKEQRRIDKANDKFNHENAEFQAANAHYESFYGGSTKAAEVTSQPQP